MMQKKIIIDTGVYIDLFNRGLSKDIINPFQHITYLAYPVLHELWMGLQGRREIRLLTAWRDRFIQLQRIIIPTVATLVLIGEACLQLKKAGKLNPTHPKHFNDVAISAAARQVGATVITKNAKDFQIIQSVIDFDFSALR
jgi:predicted nucleic acid-binding protein